LEHPIGSIIQIPTENDDRFYDLEIIGVVKDFHFENLREEIRPMVLALSEEEDTRFLSLKIISENISETLKFVELQWEKFLPGKAFEYQFMNDDFNQHYHAEKSTAELFTSFTIIRTSWFNIIFCRTTDQRNRNKKSSGSFNFHYTYPAIKRIFKMDNCCQYHCRTDSLLFHE